MILWKKNVLLLLLAISICILPFIFSKGSTFEGADDKATEVIEEIAPNYEPWFESIIELPSSEIESLLFALQATIGAGIIGFILGRITNKKNIAGKKNENV